MFSEKERAIFHYQYEGKTRYADPIKLQRLWFRAIKGRDLKSLLSQIEAENPENDPQLDELADNAMEILLKAIAQAFGMKPLADDGSGATEQEMLDVWSEFFQYLDQKKTQEENSQTCSPSTEQASPAS